MSIQELCKNTKPAEVTFERRLARAKPTAVAFSAVVATKFQDTTGANWGGLARREGDGIKSCRESGEHEPIDREPCTDTMGSRTDAGTDADGRVVLKISDGTPVEVKTLLVGCSSSA